MTPDQPVPPLCIDQHSRRLLQLATVTIVGILVCALAILLLHLLQPMVDPIRRPMSDYALGPYRLLFDTCPQSTVLALIAAITFGITFIALKTNSLTSLRPLLGALQRTIVGLVLLWSLLAALRLRFIAVKYGQPR